MYKLTSWNVNSVKARIEHLIEFLENEQPDIICLQELKSIAENFPHEIISDLGYNIAISAQKTYNGVAILSKYPIESICTNFENDPAPEQKRFIEAEISIASKVIRVISIYVPNGQDPDSDKYQYKLKFCDAFLKHLKKIACYDEITYIAGDYNIAPDDIDVYNPSQLKEKICFTLAEKIKWREFVNCSYTDIYRFLYPNKQGFTWWDYRGGSYQHNKGMRIDHILASPKAIELTHKCSINTEFREKQRPSDHAPITTEFSI